ncbi:MAG: hypothetical protein ACRBK7_03670 [Acidimicrobiales bacterium]
MTVREQLEVVILIAIVVAMVLAALITPLLLAGYRRGLRANMRAVGPAQVPPTTPLPPPPGSWPAPVPTVGSTPPGSRAGANAIGGVLEVVTVDHPVRSEGSTIARRHRRLSAIVYLAGGLIFGLVAGALVIVGGDFEVLSFRTVVVGLAFSSPNLIVLAVIFGFRSSAFAITVAAYAIGFVALGIGNGLSGEPELVAFLAPLLIWAFFGVPSLPLLLLLSRRLRAVTPVIVFIIGLAMAGTLLVVGLLNYDPVTRAAVDVAVTLGVGAWSVLTVFALVGFVAFGAIGWVLATRSGSGASRRFLSKEGVVIDIVWVLQSLLLSVHLRAMPLAAVLPLIAYKSVTTVGLMWLRQSLNQHPPQHLLLLRVFGDRDRSSRLLDDLRNYWSYLGTIRLISAPDLASHVIDHRTVLLFVSGRLRSLFLRNTDDLQRRLAEVDDQRQSDGRYRLEPLYCQGDVWRQAVQSLMTSAQLVLMDLRSFDRTRQGCIFEIDRLLDLVPTERIVLLVDQATDLDFLNEVLYTKWARLEPYSPNHTARRAQLVRLRVDDAKTSPTDWLISYASHRG